ncbi:unnamed protein product [Phaeothamnion confervicola]
MASHAVRHHYPVAIVGAGPSGLVLSSLLSRWGVKHVLLERREALTRHPQAHYISLRTMEILRHALPDVEASVLRACAPARDWRDFVVCSAVTERELGRVDNFTSGMRAARRYEGLSPARVAHLPQHRFLDMLLADTRNASAAAAVAAASQADGGGADILFGAEVHRLHLPTSSAGDAGPSGFSRINCRSPRGDGDNSSAGHGRTATSSREITCDRLVGADGSSSTVRAALGVRLLGGRGGSPLGHLINVHFRVGGGGGGGRNGLAARLPGPRPAMLYWVYNEAKL